jgi:YfiH family protein
MWPKCGQIPVIVVLTITYISSIQVLAVIKRGKNGIPFYQFSLLKPFSEIVHGVFTRIGGVSPSPFNTLNVSFLCGDRRENVQHNREMILEIIEMKKMVSGSQTHGDKALVIADMDLTDNEIEGFDALITNIPGIALLVKQADCQSVLLYEPVKGVIANIHCGWRGSVRNVIGSAIGVMIERFECEPSNLLACIGPSLGPCCAEFTNYEDHLPRAFEKYMVSPYHFDFWKISIDQLRQEGLNEDHMEVARVCTRCNSGEFFSYRKEKKTGRFGTVIGLR